MKLPPGHVHPVQRARSRLNADRTRSGTEPVSIRTRGPIPVPGVLASPTPLRRFVGDHRSQMNGAPLVTFLFGHAFDGAHSTEARFAAALNETLDMNSDVAWIVSSGDGVVPFGTIRALTSTLAWNEDAPIWRNLVADILFFPASSPAEEDAIGTFRRRASVVIVPADAPRLREFGRAAAAARIPVVGWSEDNHTIEPIGPDAFWDLQTETPIDAGAYLAEVAIQLTMHDDRRPRFRLLLDRFAETPNWPATAIDYLDRHSWARWTVGTLPSLYLRTGDEAYVWHLIYDCVRTMSCEIKRSLCDGAILRIVAADNVHAVIADINAQLEQTRDRHREVSDSILFGQFSMTLSDLARSWAVEHSKAILARHIKALVPSVETRRHW